LDGLLVRYWGKLNGFWLVGRANVLLTARTLVYKMESIQKLPDEDRNCKIFFSDGLIQFDKTNFVY
jgi:hypothetical protein